MIPPTRRRFIQQAAGSLTALCVYPFAAGSDDSKAPAAAEGSIPSPDPAAVRSFAGQIDGHLVTPDTPDYESARFIFNRAFDRHPALILYCASRRGYALHHAPQVANFSVEQIQGHGRHPTRIQSKDGCSRVDTVGLSPKASVRSAGHPF